MTSHAEFWTDIFGQLVKKEYLPWYIDKYSSQYARNNIVQTSQFLVLNLNIDIIIRIELLQNQICVGEKVKREKDNPN